MEAQIVTGVPARIVDHGYHQMIAATQNLVVAGVDVQY